MQETTNTPIRCIVAGATGRMGRSLVEAVLNHPHCTLTAALVRSESSYIGKDIGHIINGQKSHISCTDDIVEACLNADAVLDFTTPEYSVNLAEMTAQARLTHIIGTTGFTQDQQEILTAASYHARIVQSGNMSLGINLLQHLVQTTSQFLDTSFDIEIVESHHNQKKDAPSGTALMLAKTIAKERNIDLNNHAEFTRHGTDNQRKNNHIGFASIRGGNIIGDHQVQFLGQKEHIILSHHAQDRSLFADGTLYALQWAIKQNPGLYTMQDVFKKTPSQ